MDAPLLLLSAAAILVFIGGMHSHLGERYLFKRLFRLDSLPLLRNDRRYTERVMRFAWHLTSVAWWSLAAILVMLAVNAATMQLIGRIIGGTLIITGAVILATAGTRHPAWWLFPVAGLLAIFGA